MNYPIHLKQKKEQGQALVMLTAYDAPTAGLLAECGVDAILVGDSLGNVFAGYSSTLPVTMDQMIYHTQAVRRGAPDALVIGDMPFLSYQTTLSEAIANAGRFLKEAGAQAVKLETEVSHVPVAAALVAQGIPVLAHVGLRPQSVNQQGGYKIQGKTDSEAEALVQLCLDLESVGCFGVVLECIPHALAEMISLQLEIPTFGIGSGPACDGQILVTSDVLGLTDKKPPKFVTPYAHLYPQMKDALSAYCKDVRDASVSD
jgi:3-methyl-2-oxobutanoate hydroxymethyltransferase